MGGARFCLLSTYPMKIQNMTNKARAKWWRRPRKNGLVGHSQQTQYRNEKERIMNAKKEGWVNSKCYVSSWTSVCRAETRTYLQMWLVGIGNTVTMILFFKSSVAAVATAAKCPTVHLFVFLFLLLLLLLPCVLFDVTLDSANVFVCAKSKCWRISQQQQ